MSTQKATKAVVWGNNIGIVYTPTSGGSEFDSATDGLPQSSTFTREADEQEIRDYEGEVVNLTIYNKRNTLEIEVIPVGTTLANARTANVCPDYGDLVTISDNDGGHTQLDASATSNTGKYICVGSSQASTNTGETRINMSLRVYEANDLTTTISS